MEAKYNIIAKRIAVERAKHHALLKIHSLYSKVVKNEDVVECEKELLAHEKIMISDLKGAKKLGQQLTALKDSIYPVAIVKEDQAPDNKEYLHTKAGDKVYLIRHEQAEIYFVQHSLTDQKGLILAKYLKVDDSVPQPSRSNGQEEAEETLHSIEQSSRKEKLGHILGLSENEVQRGIVESKSPFKQLPHKRNPLLKVTSNSIIFLLFFFS